MPAHNEAEIRAQLADWTDAALGTDLASAGVLQAVEIRGDAVTLRLHYPFPVARYRREVESALRKQLAIPNLEVIAESAVEPQAVQGGMSPFPHIRNIIAIASGKGGVGKSTTAVNLAIALADEGARVGILDADIYGPSQPQMLGLSGKPVSHDGKTMQAMQAHGVKCMSIGFLVDTEQPMIWRGPMVSQALTQLLHETDWGELDYLVVDMPPGTGDTQLTMSQRVPLAGAVIVTTPQDIALLDARRGLKMFEKVAVPVLGIVENMGTHICSQCGHEEAIFGADGGRKMAEQYAVPLLGSLPLDIRIRSEADSGHPTVAADPDGELAARYRAIARRMVANLGLRENSQGGFPVISEDNS